MKTQKFGWSQLFIGLALLFSGVFFLFNPIVTTGLLTVFISILIIGSSAISIYVAITRKGEHYISSLILSVLSLFLGMVMLLNIQLGATILISTLGFYFIVSSATQLFLIARATNFSSSLRLFYGIFAFLGVLFGVIIMFNPGLGVLTSNTFIVLALLVQGIYYVAGAFFR